MPYIDKEKFRMHIVAIRHNPLKVILTDKEKEKFTRMLDEVPTADVVDYRRGEWIPILEINENGEPYQVGVYCSECGDAESYEPYFCPNCGADMRKETEK